MDQYALEISKNALYLIMMLSGPAVGVALTVGLIISLVQATTQIQEQSLTFVPKLIGVFLTLALIGPWLMSKLVNFSRSLLANFPNYIH